MKIIPLIILLLTISSKLIYSQSNELESQLNIAQNLFKNEKYFDAVTEYKRLLFFDDVNEYTFKANFMIGMSYKMGAKFSDAIIYFTKAEIAAKDNEEIYNSKIEKIRCNILRRTTENAMSLIDEIEDDKNFIEKINELNYWRGWANIFSDNWEEASIDFMKSNFDLTLSDFCKAVNEKEYSIVFATISSVIVPGSGQFYTGHYLSGLLSLGWNILWGYIAVNAFIENRIFDGFAVANLLWLRFYNGNLQNAKKFAEENNLKITNQALYYLQYQYEGLKP